MNFEELKKAIAPLPSGAYDIVLNIYSRNYEGKYEFAFNFNTGGFNSEFAWTKEEAIAQANAKYNDLTVDESTVRKVTKEQSADLNRIANMMSF